jgi:hypothetical protein
MEPDLDRAFHGPPMTAPAFAFGSPRLVSALSGTCGRSNSSNASTVNTNNYRSLYFDKKHAPTTEKNLAIHVIVQACIVTVFGVLQPQGRVGYSFSFGCGIHGNEC